MRDLVRFTAIEPNGWYVQFQCDVPNPEDWGRLERMLLVAIKSRGSWGSLDGLFQIKSEQPPVAVTTSGGFAGNSVGITSPRQADVSRVYATQNSARCR